MPAAAISALVGNVVGTEAKVVRPSQAEMRSRSEVVPRSSRLLPYSASARNDSRDVALNVAARWAP